MCDFNQNLNANSNVQELIQKHGTKSVEKWETFFESFCPRQMSSTNPNCWNRRDHRGSRSVYSTRLKALPSKLPFKVKQKRGKKTYRVGFCIQQLLLAAKGETLVIKLKHSTPTTSNENTEVKDLWVNSDCTDQPIEESECARLPWARQRNASFIRKNRSNYGHFTTKQNDTLTHKQKCETKTAKNWKSSWKILLTRKILIQNPRPTGAGIGITDR